MPNLRKRFQRFVDALTGHPEYDRYMKENTGGYRNRQQAIDEYFQVYLKPDAVDYRLTAYTQREYALKLYGRAGRPKLGFIIIGNSEDRLNFTQVSTEAYPFIDDALFQNFGALRTGKRPIGSVLASMHWSFYMNDLMIYGGIANRVPFYLASRRIQLALWEDDNVRPTVFARELMGLFSAGYELRGLPDGSEMLVPPEDAEFFSLTRYIAAIPHFSTHDMVTAMTQPNLRGIRFLPGIHEILPYPHPEEAQ